RDALAIDRRVSQHRVLGLPITVVRGLEAEPGSEHHDEQRRKQPQRRPAPVLQGEAREKHQRGHSVCPREPAAQYRTCVIPIEERQSSPAGHAHHDNAQQYEKRHFYRRRKPYRHASTHTPQRNSGWLRIDPLPTEVPTVTHPAQEPVALPTPRVIVPIGVRPPKYPDIP